MNEQKVAIIQAPEWEGKLEVVKSLCANGATHAEFEVFAHTARQTGLDPLRKQIYMLNMGGGKRQIVTGIDGFRLIANRSGKYSGQLGPFWCGEDGQWVDVWLKKTPPAAAKVGVMRTDFAEPLWGVAVFSEYSKGVANWKSMPAVMIAKCAEALAIRKAFPEDLSGVYSPDEMDQAVRVEPVKVEAVVVEAQKGNDDDIPFGESVPTPAEELKSFQAWVETAPLDQLAGGFADFSRRVAGHQMVLAQGWRAVAARKGGAV